jgi:RNA-directed DNA polymerase
VGGGVFVALAGLGFWGVRVLHLVDGWFLWVLDEFFNMGVLQVRRLSREWISSSHQQLVVTAAASFCEARPVLTQREHFWRFISDSRQPCSSASFDSTFVSDELNRIFDDNKRDPDLVNHNLYQLLLEEDMIRLAHKSLVVAAGHEKDFYERRKLVREIANELVDEKFQFEVLPKPTPHEGASYFYQPPPFRDKVVVEAMRIVLEKVYEPIFLDSSQGFRPSLSRHTALMSVRRGLRHHRHALVGRLDSQGGFNHHLLAQLLEQKIGDKRFIRLIWKALKAGHGNRKPHVWTVKDAWDGKPEATTLSTLFSNVFLHSLDCWVKQKLRIANIMDLHMLFYVRYGDEFMFSVVASKSEILTLKKDLEDFLKQDMQLDIPEDFSVTRFASSHAFFLGTKISVTSKAGSGAGVVGRVRLEAPMDRIILELAKLGMVSVGGTRPHPVTYLARCSHNEIISYYNWVMRGCCTYYSFVDNFYQLTSYLRLALRSSCVRTLTMKLKRFRAARTYKAPIRNGHVVDDQLSEEERSLLKDRMKAAKRLRLEWEQFGAIEKGLLQRFIIPRRREEPNGDVNLEFRGDYLLYCSKNTEHEETKRALRKLELLPPAQNIWDFKETLVPPPRPRLSVDYESLYPH